MSVRELCLIECTGKNCSNSVTEEYGGDVFQFAKDMIKEGWRTTKQNIYCPKCAKKKGIK